MLYFKQSIDGCLLTLNKSKNGSYFADFEQVKKIRSYFADFEQVKKIEVILLTLNKLRK